jgi:hypothetical protein
MISNNFRTILVQVLFIIVILLSLPNMLHSQSNSGLVVVSIGGTGIENGLSSYNNSIFFKQPKQLICLL